MSGDVTVDVGDAYGHYSWRPEAAVSVYDAFRRAASLVADCEEREEFDTCVWLTCHVVQFVAVHAVAIGMDPTWATEQFRFDGDGPVAYSPLDYQP